jgi:hypothetical protein
MTLASQRRACEALDPDGKPVQLWRVASPRRAEPEPQGAAREAPVSGRPANRIHAS